jgi:D-sedoheptulose 7-phosphate isomerase
VRPISLANAIRRAKRVFICGNGGSYANAVHIANDLISVGIPAFTIDPATLTAIANDFGYENAFSRWLATVAEEGDLLLALSGSGNSPNIINALLEAEKIGMDSFAIVGDFKTVGRAAELAKNVIVYGRGMQSAEAQQIIVGHKAMLCLKNS